MYAGKDNSNINTNIVAKQHIQVLYDINNASSKL